MVEHFTDDLAGILDILVARTVALLVIDLLKAVDITDRNSEFEIFCLVCYLIVNRRLYRNIGMLILDVGQGILVSQIHGRTDLGFEL